MKNTSITTTRKLNFVLTNIFINKEAFEGREAWAWGSMSSKRFFLMWLVCASTFRVPHHIFLFIPIERDNVYID